MSLGLLTLLIGCTNLDLLPEDERLTEEKVFSDPAAYKQYLAKLYAGLAVTSQRGPTGYGDIEGIDEGFSNYLRQYYQMQELTTDAAVIGWNDGTIADLHGQTWTTTNEFISAIYNRVYFQVSQCNEFLRQSATDKLTSRNIPANIQTEVVGMRLDARFLRALSYWHGLDMFGGNIPFVTETDNIGSIKPLPTTKAALFAFIEKELKEIEATLPAPKKGEYGRADQAAAWALLAKLYLNAEVYLGAGQGKYADCITYCNKIIASNAYTLHPNYSGLFLADNDKSPEIIFPICFDDKTRTWGGMTYLCHAPVGGTMKAVDYGLDGGWGGLRVTGNFVDLFPDDSAKIDNRGMFYRNGQQKNVDAIGAFTNGYAFPKYKNITSTGVAGKNLTHPDTDFPMFRLADVYLMYAEAHLRGGGGDLATALGYVNKLRARAYGNATGNQTALTLPFILAERGRELSWECHRRTDLIRFNQFTENGVWQWKGGVKAGKTTDKFRNIFPIPAADLIANPNLKQNDGY